MKTTRRTRARTGPFGLNDQHVVEFRVPLILDSPKPKTERSVYKRSDGSEYSLTSRQSVRYRLETGFLDAVRHELMAAGLENVSLEVDGNDGRGYQRYTVDAEYEPQWETGMRYPMATARATLTLATGGRVRDFSDGARTSAAKACPIPGTELDSAGIVVGGRAGSTFGNNILQGQDFECP